MKFARLLLACLCLPSALAAQSLDALPASLAARIDAAAQQVLASTGVPSASIAVVRDGKLVYVRAYGQARLASQQPPVAAMAATPEMRYSIGSISKQFTAAAMLLLEEEGKLSLDDPVAKYIPRLTRANEVTLRMLLSHTSGYQDYWPEDYVMPPMLAPTTSDHILNRWAMKPLDFDPGTKWEYSNTNFVIAGRVVEQVSGVALTRFLQERIFKPLGMRSVYDSDQARLTAGDATGYYRHALGPLRPAPKEGAGWLFAAGELAMTAHDLALWDASLVNHSLLSAAVEDRLSTEVKLKNGSGTGYALGVSVSRPAGRLVLEHTGEVSGFVSENIVLVDEKAAVAVLTNQDAVDAASTLGHQIAGLVAPSRPAAISKEESRALAIFTGLQQGRIDRSIFTPYCNAYFTQEALDDFASSLGPLGAPESFRQVQTARRGGMTFRTFRASFPQQLLNITTYEMPDGKLEQYLVAPSR